MLHRDMPAIPVDAAARKAEIAWLFAHKLWTHDFVLDGHGNIGDGSIYDCINIEFVYVNPINETIEPDDRLNTAFRVWIEAGGWFDRSTDENEVEPAEGWNQYNRWMRSHDYCLDCGAADMETALLELARGVRWYYNDDGTYRDVPKRCEGALVIKGVIDSYKSGCKRGDDGFCVNCDYEVVE